MSDINVTMREKIHQLKAKIAKNEANIERLMTKRNKKSTCCVCKSDKIELVYCTSCHTVPVCKLHLRDRQRTQKCPRCEQCSLTRRWSIPLPK